MVDGVHMVGGVSSIMLRGQTVAGRSKLTRYVSEPGCNKQLLDEAEHDIKNYPDRGQCYLPKPKAEADNID